jgi:hypothetical protein
MAKHAAPVWEVERDVQYLKWEDSYFVACLQPVLWADIGPAKHGHQAMSGG